MAVAFVKKTWVDRLTEFPTRRILTDTQGNETTVTVSRSEGTVSQEGDAFNAQNMNDLEGRIDNAVSALSGNLTAVQTNLSTYENYVTDEVEVGTWFGKKRYRKGYHFTGTISANTGAVIDATLKKSHISSMIVYGSVKDSGGDFHTIGIQDITGSSHGTGFRVYVMADGLKYLCYGFAVSGYDFIVEYTKA